MDKRFELRRQRWTRFLDMSAPHSHMVMIRFDQEDGQDTVKPYPEKKQERIDWAMRRYERQLARAEWLEDDTIPHVWVYTGTEIFAEAFGCNVHRPEDNMPFALPLIHEGADVSKITVPDLSAPPIAVLFEMADELKKRAGADVLIQTPDVQSPMDIAALIWEKSRFFMGMFEAPEAVKELADKVRQLLTAFLDEWFSRYGKNHIAHWPDYYMEQGMTLSEDEVGAVSTDAFEEFFLPELAFLSNRYGGIGIHCCANSRHQWDGFKKIPNLKLLNLNQPMDIIMEAFKFFGPHCAMMNHHQMGNHLPIEVVESVPRPARQVFEFSATTKDEALQAVESVRRASGN